MIKKYFLILFALAIFSCEKSSDKEDFILKYYGDAYEDIGYSVSMIGTDYLIVGQYTEIERSVPGYITGSSKKMAVIRTDSNGNVIWKKAFGAPLAAVGTKAITLADGSIVAAGFALNATTLQRDFYLLKLSADGEKIIEKVITGDGNQYVVDLIDAGDGILILGTTDVKREPSTEYTGNAAGKKDAIIFKVNYNLDQVFTSQGIGYIGNDEGVAIKRDIDGGYIVIGTTDRSEYQSQSGSNIFLFRVNSSGNYTRISIIGNLKNETASDFEVLENGYLILGSTGTEGSDQMGYFWKMSSNIYASPEFDGQINWSKEGENSTYSIKGLCRYKQNYFLAAGQYGTGLSARMLIFVVDGDGTMVGDWIKIAGGTGTQSANDVIADEAGNIVAVGKNSFENNSMITFLKFRF